MKSPQDSNTYLWYTRNQSGVKGPFTLGMIRSFLLIGRLRPEDEVSQDKQAWRKVRDTQEVIPDEMKNVHTEEDRLRLLQAQLREDERARERRTQEIKAELLDLQGRRARQDRRDPEKATVRAHRELRNRLQEEYVPSFASRNLGILIGVFVVVLLVLALYAYLVSRDRAPVVSDCDDRPAPGVNWNNCRMEGRSLTGLNLAGAHLNNTDLSGADLSGANLSQADLAYANLSIALLEQANLQGASLKGAGLRSARLVNAQLQNADLAYADLRGAVLDGAQLQGARLDKAIWTDGRMCAPGSVGACKIVAPAK